MKLPVLTAGVLLAIVSASAAHAQTDDDLVFLHHSCGRNWLTNSLDAALLTKDYVDERNDIYYGTVVAPDCLASDGTGIFAGLG